MFPDKMFKINLLQKLTDTREINLILLLKAFLEYKALPNDIYCCNDTSKKFRVNLYLLLTFTDLQNSLVGSSLEMI